MPIYFRSMPVKEPYIFESVGNEWEQEQIVRPSGHPVYHYLQTEKGRGKIEIQGISYCLEEGEGVLIAPFVPHSYMGETEQWLTLFATVTGTMESNILSMTGNRQIIFTDKEQGKNITNIILEAIRMYEETPQNSKDLSVLCYSFLLNFSDGIYDNKITDNPLYQRYIQPIIKEIETNYGEKITAAELSDRVYVTQQYLSRLFRRFLGCSVYEYLTLYRISKAKELLLCEQYLEIQNIANRVGFEDASHFISMFRKATGMTPNKFRALYGGEK